MQITGENTVNSYAWVHLEWLSMHITDENTVKRLCMGTFIGFLSILLVKTL